MTNYFSVESYDKIYDTLALENVHNYFSLVPTPAISNEHSLMCLHKIHVHAH